ncbi:MAG TPA: protein kinase [Thermopolyspora sp.]
MRGQEDAWRVPGYTEIRELGSGGSGRVVLARRIGDDLPVAIKYLSEELRLDLAFVATFRHEARLLSILRTPHTAAFYEYIEATGGAAIIMELVDGVSLRALLRSQGPTGPEAALLILKGSLLGLAAAHTEGIVHRDFKPENVIVEADGNSKLVDFGIAVRSGDPSGGSGTPPYMAPEQWSGSRATPATDVYAATAVFFECLTGTRPFRGETVAALAHQHQTADPPVEEVPGPLRDLIRRGMAKHPLDRPESAEAFLDELEEIADAAYGRGWEQRGKRRLSSLAALLALLFPLAEGVPESGTALAHTELGGPAGPRKIGLKIVVGLGAIAAITGATALVVNTVNGTVLRAQSTITSPTPVSSPGTFFGEPSTGPEQTVSPPMSPTTSPAPSGTPTVATPAATFLPPTATRGPRPTPARTPTPTPTKRATPAPTATPSPTPSAGPSSEPEMTFTGTSAPKPPTAGTPTPTPSPTPTATRTTSKPTQPNPTPTQSPSPTQSDGGSDESDPPPVIVTPNIAPAALLAVGLTTGAGPATLALRRRGRHRR